MVARQCIFLLVAILICSALPARAVGPRTEPVRFAPGASSATIKGTLTGHELVDYRFHAEAGRTLTATLKSDRPTVHFNVMAPQSAEAMFVGSNAGRSFRKVLPTSGEYILRIYQLGNADAATLAAGYTLELAIAGATPQSVVTPAGPAEGNSVQSGAKDDTASGKKADGGPGADGK